MRLRLASPSAAPVSRRAPDPALRLALAAALFAGLAAGCGDPDRPGSADPMERSADTMAVRVWFQEGERVVAVTRPGVADSLGAALEALLAGPSPAERARGLDSWFGPSTAGLLREARIEDGRAVVDFDARLAATIPNASSSAGSTALLAALDSTVFQFPEVRTAEYRLGGSCPAFWEWLQRTCDLVRR